MWEFLAYCLADAGREKAGRGERRPSWTCRALNLSSLSPSLTRTSTLASSHLVSERLQRGNGVQCIVSYRGRLQVRRPSSRQPDTGATRPTHESRSVSDLSACPSHPFIPHPGPLPSVDLLDGAEATFGAPGPETVGGGCTARRRLLPKDPSRSFQSRVRLPYYFYSLKSRVLEQGWRSLAETVLVWGGTVGLMDRRGVEDRTGSGGGTTSPPRRLPPPPGSAQQAA